MCPACIATAALVATSAGGLAALAVKILRPKWAVKFARHLNLKEKSS